MRSREDPKDPQPVSPRPRARDDPLGIICCGALAFVFSSIAHEVVGHGGAALLTGARIVRISSVYFDAVGARPIVDAGGPLMNLVVSGLLLFWCRHRQPSSPYARLLACALTAFNLFWGFGYFLFSAFSGRGDWAFLFKHSESPWIWRGALIAVGIYGYQRSITVLGTIMTPFTQASHIQAPARALLRPAILLYLSAGATCCAAAVFYRGPVGPALRESVIESFGAFLGLWFVAPRKSEAHAQKEAFSIHLDWRWTTASLAVVALYVTILGRGYFG